MKQLLYFLIGFLISLFTITSYAATIDPACVDSKVSTAFIVYPTVHSTYASALAAAQALSGYPGLGAANDTLSVPLGSVCLSDLAPGTNVNISYCGYRTATNYHIILWKTGYTTYIPDTDGDGIDDECDLYPSDPTAYKYAEIASVQNSTTHEKVQIRVKSDRGDIFSFGTRPTDMTGYQDYISIAPVLKDGNLLCANTLLGGAGTTISQVDNSAYYQEVENLINAEKTKDSDQAATGMTTGEAKTGTETDSEALGKIIANTKATSDNIDRLGDYLADINSTLKKMDLKGDFTGIPSTTTTTTTGTTTGGSTETTLQGTNTKLDTLAGKLDVTESDKATGSANMGNTDTAFDTASNTISPTAALTTDAPEAYRTKINIVDKMTTYLSNNPVTAIIKTSGVTISGSQSYLTFSYKGQNILLRVDQWDSALSSFGSILLAMTTLTGIIMIFRG